MKKFLIFISVLLKIPFLHTKVIINHEQRKQKLNNVILKFRRREKNKKKFVTQKEQSNAFSSVYCNILNFSFFVKDQEYIWLKNSCRNFTELILSWNVLRPENGGYSFYVSVKYNNNWSEWLKIAEWTCKSQRTFFNSKDKFVHVKHVRLEMQKNKKACGFRVKVVAQKGADISALKALFISLSDMNKFVFGKALFNKKNILIKGVPNISQWSIEHNRAKDLCSPTSVTMLLGFYSKKGLFKIIEDRLSEFANKIVSKIHDDSYLDIYGSWALNVAQSFNSSQGKLFCNVERLNNINHLYYFLSKGIPVAVSVRGYLKGGFKSYDNGHFIIVVGWDNKRKAFLCIDPAFITEKKMLRAYNLKDFIKAWGTSRNLAYIMRTHIMKYNIRQLNAC